MVRGFSINKDGTRVPCDYDSDRERAWCECSELYDAKLYEEAYHKLDEYHATNGGRINSSDWLFIAKVEVGYLKVKPTVQNFNNSKYAWGNAIFDAYDRDMVTDLAQDMVEIFIKAHDIPVEYDDFTKAKPEQIIKTLEFMFSILKIADDYPYSLDFEESTDFLGNFCMGLRELGEGKGQILYAQAKKLSFYGKYFNKRDNNPFIDDDEE